MRSEVLYSKLVALDIKAKEQELIEKEVNKFFCEGGAIRCPVCDCQDTTDSKEDRVQETSPVKHTAERVEDCCQKYTHCNSNCRKVESAEDLYERLGWKKPSKEQQERNLESNLRHYTDSLEIE